MSNETPHALSQGSQKNQDPPYPPIGYSWYVVGVLLVAYILSFIDRQILSLLVEPMRADLGISDTQMSLLMGFSFAVFYSFFGIPLGWLADRKSRRTIIAVGVAVWSAMTAGCGMVHRYWQLLLLRMGVGVGEAALSPAAYSLISDYFPRHRLATAISVYGAGIYIGSGMAFLLGGLVVGYAKSQGATILPIVGEVRPWQAVFYIVGIPGLLLAGLLYTVKEPLRRGYRSLARPVDGRRTSQNSFVSYVKDNAATFLSHNVGHALLAFVGYASAAWVPTFFIRTHGWESSQAGIWYGVIVMIFGSAGITFGGRLADYLAERGYRDSKMRVGLLAALLGLPFAPAFAAAPNGTVAMVLLCPLCFAQALPFGTAPAAMAEMMPNAMRSQAGAVYLFIVNIISIGFGPSAVALITDRVFGYDEAIRYSLPIVNVVACAAAAVILFYGLSRFVRSMDYLETWEVARAESSS